MDIEVILDAAEVESPALRDLARRFLEVEAGQLGVPLDVGSVIARRAEGEPEVHISGPAAALVKQLTTEPGALGDDSAVMALARAGATALMTMIEMDKAVRSALAPSHCPGRQAPLRYRPQPDG